MISHENKCIFVHIPKAAGTSIIRALSDDPSSRPDRDPSPLNGISDRFNPPPPHLRVQDHLTHGMATQEQIDSYFKFTFVRNPWDRLVSEYKYRGHVRLYPFKDYVFKYLPRPSWSDYYCHIIPQYDFIFDRDGRQLVDFIGKFENLNRDFEYVCRQLGLEGLQLRRDNVSSSIFSRRDRNLRMTLKLIRDKFSMSRMKHTFDTYMEYYDDETREFVSDMYKDDITTFSYTFGK